MSEFQELGEQKTGTFNILVSYCCRTWLGIVNEHSPGLQASLTCFSHFITDSLVFGPVYKRNLRYLNIKLYIIDISIVSRVATDVNYFIESLGEECSSNSLHLR